MQEYLKVEEFAEKAGVCSEAIYKRIRKEDNPIQPFVKVVGKNKMVRAIALQVLYGINIEDTTTQPSSKVVQPAEEEQASDAQKHSKEEQGKTASTKVIDILEKQLEAQRKDIESKNFLIEELNERLAESQKMLDQQQKLSMADKARIVQLENIEKEMQLKLEASAEEERKSQEQMQKQELTTNKRKGFFNILNIFKRKQVEE